MQRGAHVLEHPRVGVTLTPKHGDLPHYPPLPPSLLKVTRISVETTSLEGSVKPTLLGRFSASIRSQLDSGSANLPRESSREWVSPSPQRGAMSADFQEVAL